MTDEVQQLFRAHYLGLVRLAMRLVDDQETAEEVVQDVFASLSGHRHRSMDDPVRYLRGAVVNRSRSVLRRRRVARAFWSRHPEDELAESPEETTIRQVERTNLLRAIRRLPRRQHEVVVLRYYADLPVAKIAQILSVSPGAVSSALNRAMGTLSSSKEGLDAYRPAERNT